MSYSSAVVANGLSRGLDNLTDVIKWDVDRKDRLKREAKQDQLYDLQLENVRMDLDSKKQRLESDEVMAELAPWLALPEEERFKQPLPEKVAAAVQPYLSKEWKDLDTAEVLTTAQAAAKAKKLLAAAQPKLAAMEQELQGRRMVVPLFGSEPALAAMKPDIERALFNKSRFGGEHQELDKDGKPTGRMYRVTGLGDLMYDTGTKQLSAQLQAVYLDGKGNPTAETLLVPATEADKDGKRTNAADAPVQLRSLEQMQQFLDGKVNSSILFLKARDQAAQQALVKHSPEARKGLTVDLVADQKQQRDAGKITAITQGTSFKTALQGTYGPLLQTAQELAQSGMLDSKGFATIVTLAATKQAEAKVADTKDEREGVTSVAGYASLGEAAPRTAKLAVEYLPLIKSGSASGKRVSSILDKVYAAEQKTLDRASTERAAAARASGATGADGSVKVLYDQIKQATNDLYGTWNGLYALGEHAPAARRLAEATAAEGAGLGKIVKPRNPNRPAVYVTNQMAAELQQRFPQAKSWEELVSWAAGDAAWSGKISAQSLSLWHANHFASLPSRAATTAEDRQKGNIKGNKFSRDLSFNFKD